MDRGNRTPARPPVEGGGAKERSSPCSCCSRNPHGRTVGLHSISANWAASREEAVGLGSKMSSRVRLDGSECVLIVSKLNARYDKAALRKTKSPPEINCQPPCISLAERSLFKSNSPGAIGCLWQRSTARNPILVKFGVAALSNSRALASLIQAGQACRGLRLANRALTPRGGGARRAPCQGRWPIELGARESGIRSIIWKEAPRLVKAKTADGAGLASRPAGARGLRPAPLAAPLRQKSTRRTPLGSARPRRQRPPQR